MEPDYIVAKIIQDYMELPAGSVFFKDQNIKGLTSGALFLIVGIQTTKPIGVKSFIDPGTDEDVQQSSIMTTVSIDIVSKSDAAKTRHVEIPMALESVIGQQLMNENSMRVFRTAEATDISAVEGASALHRYRYSVIVSSMKEIRKSTTQIFENYAQPEVNNE